MKTRKLGKAGLCPDDSLELGGNNPYIVLDDADIEAAASVGACGAFFHQGQICLTAGRHLVHERIADAYAKALVRKVKALVVAKTIAKGTKVLTGGSRKELFFEPTVIIGVIPGMAASDEERFGPVAVITTFRNDEEALALANATDYGLVAAVVSADLARAQRVADGLHSGACVASICTSAFKSGAVPACGAASSTILDEEHRLSRSVHSFFRAVRVFLSGLVDSSAFQEVSLGREVSIVFTSNGPLIYRWETHPALATHEQFRPDFVLQIVNLPAQRGL